MGMKEITPKELQKLNDKSWKETQKIFRRRLREIAKGGENKAKYKHSDYCMGDRIKPWLESLGFKVKEIGPSWCEITWPEEVDLIERLRSETFKILTQPMPAKVTWGLHLVRSEEEQEWIYNPTRYDYACSGCGKHAEYTSPYCPNCGKKMKPLEGRKYDS